MDRTKYGLKMIKKEREGGGSLEYVGVYVSVCARVCTRDGETERPACFFLIWSAWLTITKKYHQ
jgi:hypothetical protein